MIGQKGQNAIGFIIVAQNADGLAARQDDGEATGLYLQQIAEGLVGGFRSNEAESVADAFHQAQPAQ